MKLPDLYGDWRFVSGVALLVLGASNWMVGFERTHQYSQIVATASHSPPPTDFRSFDELDNASDAAVLDPLTAEERQVSYATARMDFYHATFLTGQVMVIAGLLLWLWGMIAVIQSDARRALRRSAERSHAMSPPGARNPPA
ncbi:MAG TPA: hypothetical protein VIX59_01930 [Candidatus Binataceae bacterium]